MSSYLGTVLVTTPLVGTPLLSAILYFSGESQSDNEKWANQIAEFESLCEDGYNWNEENQSCEELSFLGTVEIFFKCIFFNFLIYLENNRRKKNLNIFFARARRLFEKMSMTFYYGPSMIKIMLWRKWMKKVAKLGFYGMMKMKTVKKFNQTQE